MRETKGKAKKGGMNDGIKPGEEKKWEKCAFIMEILYIFLKNSLMSKNKPF